MSDSVAGQISADATSHVDFLTLGLQKCTLFFLHCNCSTGAQLHVKVFGIAIAVLLLSCMSIRFCYALIGIAFSHVDNLISTASSVELLVRTIEVIEN